ncbi:MAG: hypothetical protein ACRETC_04055 [Gammaproteobacteria bacterium]
MVGKFGETDYAFAKDKSSLKGYFMLKKSCLILPLIAVIIALTGCGKDSGTSAAPTSGTVSGASGNLPEIVQSLLHFQGQNMCQNLQDTVLNAIGLPQYDGSSNVPGTFQYSTDEKTRAVTITWTVQAGPGADWASGLQRFVFRISEDESALWGVNKNAYALMLAYQCQ